jgi:hypothetical protein
MRNFVKFQSFHLGENLRENHPFLFLFSRKYFKFWQKTQFLWSWAQICSCRRHIFAKLSGIQIYSRKENFRTNLPFLSSKYFHTKGPYVSHVADMFCLFCNKLIVSQHLIISRKFSPKFYNFFCVLHPTHSPRLQIIAKLYLLYTNYLYQNAAMSLLTCKFPEVESASILLAKTTSYFSRGFFRPD